MHDSVPVVRRLVSLKLHTPATSRLKATRVAQPYISNLRHERSNPIHIDRLAPGPKLKQRRTNDYYLAFKPKSKNIINSAKREFTAGNFGHNKMKCWVQFLTTPTADTPGTTLLLHFDSKRYLIGSIAEGTQRAAVQRKITLSKVEDIFLTGTVGWANTGGLLGMILTLADSTTAAFEERKRTAEEANRKKGGAAGEVEQEKQWLNIHGGRNLTHLLATARRFVFRKGMPLFTNEYRSQPENPSNWEPTWSDDRIKVWAMVVEPDIRAMRKRSHDEFTGAAPSTAPEGQIETQEEQEDRYDQMRRAVVASMFDSSWRMDTLVKKKLSQVQRPAAIFRRNSEGKIERYYGPTLDEDPHATDIDVLVRNPWPGALVESLPPTVPSPTSMCYIIKNHPQRGKFNPQKAKDAGVKPGPEFRRLTEGQSVTTVDGKVVTPEMVMAPGKEGGGFAVIDLPDTSYIAPLLARDEWSAAKVMNGIGAAIWILGPGVAADPRLLKFMQELKDLKHIVSSKDCCANYISLESPAAAAIRLHLLDAERFPIPQYSNEIPHRLAERPYERARVGHTIQLEPKVVLEDNAVVRHLDTGAIIKDTSSDVLKLAGIARDAVSRPEYQALLDENQKDILCKDAEIITLGTGSALPSKYRNVSATLLRVPGSGNYLFDCGENTLGQLKRVFGAELPGILKELKVIWISHLHADHHLGTASVIRAWADETKSADPMSTKEPRLLVASDEGMLKWLQEFSEVEDYGYARIEPLIMRRSNGLKHEFSPEETNIFGLSSIVSCLVQHCHGALAVAFNFPNGFKVAYSGDCRPSDKFVDIGKGATLLIHEATFDDELQGDAIAKKHSTTSEALDIGRRMGARRVLLTHFSQRYQKIPVMDSHGGKDQVAIVAFDYMRCKIGDFAKLEAFKPALMKLYELKED